jgi:cathepsin L
MKALLLVALLGLALANASVFKEEEYQLLFTRFMTQYNKKYTHDTFFYRYTVFKANMDKVYLANKQKHSYTLGMNEMGDMTHAEFKATKLGYNKIDRSYARKMNSAGPHQHVVNAPVTVDWRGKAVTPIKNQQQCGSCWAFSTTGSVEGAVALSKNGKLTSLSEQQLVDCSSAQGNQGCEGGLMDQAFQYIISNGGLTTESNYPYTAMDGTCNTTAAAAVASTITGYTDVASGSESGLVNAVAIGPVSVAIEADQACFQFYSGGILSDPTCGTNLDHGVLAVGYDQTNKYWIVKNSWGTSWGMAGYIEIAMGMDECGINTEPSYPTGASVIKGKHGHGKKL